MNTVAVEPEGYRESKRHCKNRKFSRKRISISIGIDKLQRMIDGVSEAKDIFVIKQKKQNFTGR